MPTVISIAPYKFLPAKIGGQKGIALFNQYFSRYVQLVCLTIAGNENNLANYEAVELFPNSKWRYIDLFLFFRIRKILRQKQASHLLIEHPYFGWLGVLLKKFTRVKLIIHSHNIEGNRFKTLGKWWASILWSYEKWTHRHADYNFFVTEADLNYAVQNFGLTASKCLVVTYGIERNAVPSKEEIIKAKQFVKNANHIGDDEKILFFNGSFNYAPNVDALNTIANVICPLLDTAGFKYKMIICGPWLTNNHYDHPHLIIKGFVDNIEPYVLAADVFLNPVMDGGGIKTKLVEAISYNVNAVSTHTGSTGVDPSICNGKLSLVEDGNWEVFAAHVIAQSNMNADTPAAFYNYFYWGNNTKNAADFIQI
ncbi:MAG: glycosyltransferase [Flavisolibacter sp.]